MKYVVKLGGAGLENPALLEGCTRAIVELARDGNQVAVVHGGGVQLTRTLKALGKQSEFINGLRVTDAETRDVALMVFAGRVNKSLVAALGALGQPAVGLSGGDGLLFRARKKCTTPDLGFVGEIAKLTGVGVGGRTAMQVSAVEPERPPYVAVTWTDPGVMHERFSTLSEGSCGSGLAMPALLDDQTAYFVRSMVGPDDSVPVARKPSV